MYNGEKYNGTMRRVYTIFYLIHNRIINNANQRDFSNRKSNGNTHKREATKNSIWFCL